MQELSLHILDMLENARQAGATLVDLSIEEDPEADRLSIAVRDNGRGMDAETASRALDPFFTSRTTRKVGLGLPLLAAAARQCGGNLELSSAPGRGTTIKAVFQHSHLDRAPLGNLADTLVAFLIGEREVDLRYSHRIGDRIFQLDTVALREKLGEVPLSHPKVRDWLRQFIMEGEAELASPRGEENA